MKIIITGGGTGGHIYPALSVGEQFINVRRDNVLFIGSKQRIEKVIVPENDILFYGNDIIAFSKLKFIIFTFKLCKSFFTSLQQIKKFKPEVVFGTGGYITVPVILAAKLLKIKTIILENDATMGSANKFLAKYVDEVVTGFDLGKYKYTGNPRGSLVYQESLKYTKKNNYDLCIFMGSLGSLTISKFLLENLDALLEKYCINLITGENYFSLFANIKHQNLNIKAYSHDIIQDYVDSEIIICRSGAVTISEVMALNKLCIFIPSPYVKNDEQKINAMQLKKQNACSLILENELNIEILLNSIKLVYNNKVEFKENALKFQKNNALNEIVKSITKLVGEENVEKNF